MSTVFSLTPDWERRWFGLNLDRSKTVVKEIDVKLNIFRSLFSNSSILRNIRLPRNLKPLLFRSIVASF